MRLLYLVHQFLPRHVTGTEQYVRSLALALRAAGHEVEVFAFAPLIQHDAPGAMQFVRDETVDGIPVRRVSVHPLGSANPEWMDYHNPIVAQMLAAHLDQRAAAGRPFDLVHVFHARSIGAAAIDEPMRRGLPVVVNLMDFWFLCPNFTLLRRDGTRHGSLCDGPPQQGLGCVPCIAPELGDWLEQAAVGRELVALRDVEPAFAGSEAARAHALVARAPRLFAALARANAIVAPSRFVRAKFEAAGFPAGRIQHVPYGIDAARLAGVAPRRPGGPAGELAIGFLGSIAPHKGVHVLVAAARQLGAEAGAGGWRLTIHGDQATHVEYTAELKQLAAGEPRITFPGPFRPGELGRVLAALDVVVVPSLWYENTPFTVLEALAAQRFVVASDLGGISEVVRDGENGALFPAGDAGALARVLRRLVDAPDALAQRPERPPPRTIAENADDFLRLYRELVPGSAPRPRAPKRR